MSFSQLYLTGTAAAYSPATIRGAWDDTASVVTKALATTKTGGGLSTEVNFGESSADPAWDGLLYRGVSPPLKAQTITGTVVGVYSAYVWPPDAASDFHHHVHIYVTQGDSDTPRGTLLSDYREASGVNNWPLAAGTTQWAAAQTLTPLAIQDGDRLVVEIGAVARNAISATSYFGILKYGTLGASGTEQPDMVHGSGAATDAPLLAFSTTIFEQTDPPTFNKLYLGAFTAAYTPATIRGAWDDTAGSVTRCLVPSKETGGNNTSVARAETSADIVWDVLLYRGVSGKLAAQTITGSVGVLIGVWEQAADADMMWHVHIYVTQGDSDTPRGTLLSDYREQSADLNEWLTSPTLNGLRFSAGASRPLTPLAIASGDRLVVEIGYVARNSLTASRAGNLRYGTKTGAGIHGFGGTTLPDLTPGGNSSTSAGYIEFSASIGEASNTQRVSQIVVETLSGLAVGTRVSQVVVETLSSTSQPARASQVVAETVSPRPPGPANVTQVVVETIAKPALYDCPTAPPGPSICGSEPVLTWIEETHTLVASPSERRVVSDIALNDPATYFGGKKEPRVLAWGTILRALSDVQGQWTAATMRWREAEIDRAVRRRFGDPARYPVVNAIDVCRMIRESDWRDQLDPRLMFIGHRLRAEPTEDRSVDQESGDLLARDLETAGQEVQSPRRKFSANFTPGIPKELIDLPEPIIYGRYSDALNTATPPDMIASAIYGAWTTSGGIDFGWASMPCDCLAPTGVSLTEGAGGSIETGAHPSNKLFAIVTSVDATGRESDPSTFAQRDTTTVPSVTITGSGKTVTVTWSAPAGTTPTYYRIYLGHESVPGMVSYYQWMQIAGTDPRTVTFDNAPSFDEVSLDDYSQVATGAERVRYSVFAYYAAAAQMADGSWTALASPMGIGMANPYRRTARVEFTNIPPGTVNVGIWKFPEFTLNRPPLGYFIVPYTGSPLPTYVDDDWLGTNQLTTEQPPIERGLIDLAPYYGGQELIAHDGQYWHRWFVASHACAAVTLYIDGRRIEVDQAGVDWLWPGAPGYEDRFGTAHYRDLNGRRYCVVYGRGPEGDRAAMSSGYEPPEDPDTGSPDDSSPSSPAEEPFDAMTLYANVLGIETEADGTGSLIEDIFEQEIHWWANWGPFGDYQSGDWLPLPDWTPIEDHCKFSTESWRDARDAAAAEFGAVITGAAYITDQLGMRDWIAKWRLSTDTRIGVNAAGQWILAWHSETAPRVGTFTEQRHVQADSVTFEPLHDEHWTVVPYQFAEDRITDTWQTGELEDDDETAAYGERRVADVRELFFIRSAAVAQFLVGRFLARHAKVPWRVTFETIDLCGTNVDLGDVIGLTGLWGLDTDGWTSFALVIERVEVLTDVQRVQISARPQSPSGG